MLMDAEGNTLYFGSYHELMIVTTSNNQVSKEVPSVPGVVLGVSPSGSTVIINDQLRQVIYLYSTATGTVTSTGGIGHHAEYSPDGATVYISGQDPGTGQNTLFVYNASSGWTSYPLTNQPTYSCQLEAAGSAAYPAYNPNWDPFCGGAVAVTNPGVAAFFSGNTTAARSYCPNASSNPIYYPPAGDTNTATDQLGATPDGFHILGANTTNFSDIWLQNTPAGGGSAVPGVPTGACPAFNGPALTLNTTFNTAALPVAASEIDQVVSSPYANLAFVTYQGASATGALPYYVPGATAGSFGTLNTVQLSSGAAAPVAGIFSPDGSIFFASTSGDNLVHMVNTTTLTDTQTIDPKLLNGSGARVPAQFLAVKSRPTT
jgi:hypothetical protein